MRQEPHQQNDLSPFELRIILIVAKQYKVTMKDFLKQLPAKETCIKTHVKRLVDKGFIKQCGKGRETWYEGVV